MELRKADKMMARAIELEPNNVNLLDTYAWVFFMRGDYKSARFYLERALSYEQSGVVYDHYGDVLYKIGQREKAMAMWKKAPGVGNDSAILLTKIETGEYIPDIKIYDEGSGLNQ